MNQLTKTALVALGAALTSGSAHASYNDLVLGFNGNGAGSDYVINLGNYLTSVGVGGSSVVDLSGYFSLSTFNGNFLSSGHPTSDGVTMGVGGGTVGTAAMAFLTEQRAGGAGVAAIPGSSTPASQTLSDASATAGYFNAVINNTGSYPALGSQGGSALVLVGDAASWTSKVTAGSGQSLLAQKGINDVSPMSGGMLFEDLYEGTKSGSTEIYSYKGYFTLNLNGSSPVLDFTPAPVPEPSTCLLIGTGLLILVLRTASNRRPA
jgi:hypothetical protein